MLCPCTRPVRKVSNSSKKCDSALKSPPAPSSAIGILFAFVLKGPMYLLQSARPTHGTLILQLAHLTWKVIGFRSSSVANFSLYPSNSRYQIGGSVISTDRLLRSGRKFSAPTPNFRCLQAALSQ